MTVRITAFNTFGEKRFALVSNRKELILVNLWGFGLWITPGDGKGV